MIKWEFSCERCAPGCLAAAAGVLLPGQAGEGGERRECSGPTPRLGFSPRLQPFGLCPPARLPSTGGSACAPLVTGNGRLPPGSRGEHSGTGSGLSPARDSTGMGKDADGSPVGATPWAGAGPAPRGCGMPCSLWLGSQQSWGPMCAREPLATGGSCWPGHVALWEQGDDQGTGAAGSALRHRQCPGFGVAAGSYGATVSSSQGGDGLQRAWQGDLHQAPSHQQTPSLLGAVPGAAGSDHRPAPAMCPSPQRGQGWAQGSAMPGTDPLGCRTQPACGQDAGTRQGALWGTGGCGAVGQCWGLPGAQAITTGTPHGLGLAWGPRHGVADAGPWCCTSPCLGRVWGSLYPRR